MTVYTFLKPELLLHSSYPGPKNLGGGGHMIGFFGGLFFVLLFFILFQIKLKSCSDNIGYSSLSNTIVIDAVS